MRIVAFPTIWDKTRELTPVDVQDIEILATVEELKELARFFSKAS